MVWMGTEMIVLLIVVGLAVAISSSASFRSTLLTIFGVLGLGLIVLAVMCCIFVLRGVKTHQHEIMHFGSPLSPPLEVQSIHLDGSEPLVITHTSQVSAPKPTTVVAKKPVVAPAPAPESTAIEDLPVRAKESTIKEATIIDEQTRAEIEQQWREGQLHDRLVYMGTGAATLIGLLATLFGYLKLDQLSQAKRRRGLQAGAAGVILAVALVAALA
jgi:hypothetical protein